MAFGRPNAKSLLCEVTGVGFVTRETEGKLVQRLVITSHQTFKLHGLSHIATLKLRAGRASIVPAKFFGNKSGCHFSHSQRDEIMNVSRKLSQLLFLCAGVVIFGCSFSSHAAVAIVVVGTNNTDTFTPAVTNIATGDSVVWVWNYSSTLTKHSTTSGTNGVPSGLWGSATNAPPYFFTNTFSSAGTYRYYCAIHLSPLA